MYNDSFRVRYGAAPIAISSTEDFSPTAPHIHNEIEMLLILEGASDIQISNQVFSARAGDLFFINPLEAHAITARTESPYRHRCVCFDPALIADRRVAQALQTGQLAIVSYFRQDDANTSTLAALFHKLYSTVEENAPALLFDVTALISMLFSVFIKEALLTEKNAASKEAQFCAAVLDYIAAHFDQPVTSGEIAQQLFYTQNHFCRKFKRIFGVRFSEYLNMYRLLAAKELLRTSREKITVIAARCGFGDAVYFTKCFRNYYGMPPLRWQKSQCRTKI